MKTSQKTKVRRQKAGQERKTVGARHASPSGEEDAAAGAAAGERRVAPGVSGGEVEAGLCVPVRGQVPVVRAFVSVPKSRQLRDKCPGVTRLLQCTNHPANPGGIEEVLPTDTCRNFKAKSWKWPKAKPVKGSPAAATCKSGRKVERIPLGDGLFAIVDAADYPEISKYRWYASPPAAISTRSRSTTGRRCTCIA